MEGGSPRFGSVGTKSTSLPCVIPSECRGLLCAARGGERDTRQKVGNIGGLCSREESGCGGSNSSENVPHMSLAVFTAYTAHYHCHVGDRSDLPPCGHRSTEVVALGTGTPLVTFSYTHQTD